MRAKRAKQIKKEVFEAMYEENLSRAERKQVYNTKRFKAICRERRKRTINGKLKL